MNALLTGVTRSMRKSALGRMMQLGGASGKEYTNLREDWWCTRSTAGVVLVPTVSESCMAIDDLLAVSAILIALAGCSHCSRVQKSALV